MRPRSFTCSGTGYNLGMIAVCRARRPFGPFDKDHTDHIRTGTPQVVMWSKYFCCHRPPDGEYAHRRGRRRMDPSDCSPPQTHTHQAADYSVAQRQERAMRRRIRIAAPHRTGARGTRGTSCHQSSPPTRSARGIRRPWRETRHIEPGQFPLLLLLPCSCVDLLASC